MNTPLSLTTARPPSAFTDHLDLMFGMGHRVIKDELYVKVWRDFDSDAGRRYFRKKYLRFKDETNQEIDLSIWTDREEQLFSLLNLWELGLNHVQLLKGRRQSWDRKERELETWDAGPDGDQWQQVPVARNGDRLPHLFMDCAHWFSLARWLLVALDEVHKLGFVHVDLKGDNFCIPVKTWGTAVDGYPERVQPDWEKLSLIDFAFSLWHYRLPLHTPLPIGESKKARYQSQRLIEALKAGQSSPPDLTLTEDLDWRVDIYSLGFVLNQILTEVEWNVLPKHQKWGWLEERYKQAQHLIQELQSWEDLALKPVANTRPHASLISLLDKILQAEDLANSLKENWEIVRDVNWRHQDPTVRTPPTVPAPNLRQNKIEPATPPKFIVPRWLLVSLAVIGLSLGAFLLSRNTESPTPQDIPLTAKPNINIPKTLTDTPKIDTAQYSYQPIMKKIIGGCFHMGSSDAESGRDKDERQHKVCVGNFEIGMHEVTQGQWREIMDNNPSHFHKGDNYPVEQISWNDIQVYLKKLNEKTNKDYRLPTEAEWEYACRGGAVGEIYCGGNDASQVGWYDENSNSETQAVGSKSANKFGLHDMSGNVWEWTCSTYNEKYSRGMDKICQEDKTMPLVMRGGSWFHGSAWVRSANRRGEMPYFRHPTVGFRLARSL